MVVFTGLASLIWFSGTRLSYLVDALAEKTKIARAMMGLIILAAITELPEMVTTMTAAWTGNAALALNNMFGGITMQTAILAIADVIVVKAVLTTFPRKPTPIIEGLFLIIMLTILSIVSLTGDWQIIGHLGLVSIFLALFYMLCLFVIQNFVTIEIWNPVDLPNPSQTQDCKRYNAYDKKPLRHLFAHIVIAALVILIAGTLLTLIADTLALQTGLGSSFVGATLLAATTSLPELSTTIASVRLKAYTMAISNILGSNLIMVFLIFPADLMYDQGPILNYIDQSAAFALGSGILVTAIYCAGLLIRRKRRIFNIGIDSLLVLLVYFVSLIMLYYLR